MGEGEVKRETARRKEVKTNIYTVELHGSRNYSRRLAWPLSSTKCNTLTISNARKKRNGTRFLSVASLLKEFFESS